MSPLRFGLEARHLAWAVTMALALCGSARAAEAHGAAAEHKPAPRAAGKAVAAPAPAEADLDQLRQRLNDRMSAIKPAPGGAPEVRVINKDQGVTTRVRAAAAAPAQGHGATPRPAAAAAALAAGVHGGHGGAAHWSYGSEGGPADWGQLKPEFLLCGTGRRQSPIDIRGGIAVELEPIRFDYKPGGFNVIDNGHTVQANVASGSSIQLGGRRYDLVQFHFHRPSEERINGRQYDMVAHLVHKDLDGRLAVVAVLLEQGRAHPAVQQVWNALPLEKNEEVSAPSVLDLNQLLPEDRRYFTYMGSLTTPPCSEGVLWLVMKQPVQLSQEQLGVFVRLYPMNARPIQPVAGRLIKESN
ncbi:carbonic anhydrase [Sphaerotilus hippei]|uniref:carbonic anhydrase n=1 Tax=Sphaerotilus hippei TaxID=744406 RepID=A0A318HCC1_9BURK|nr:carbonic anhydrase family protein [Sphaerotilus hippei]PXW96931.1 carbonic anhydrase [Sphaerotilus hippei]